MEHPLKLDAIPKPYSTEVDFKNSFANILEGDEEFVVSVDGKVLSSNLEAVNLTGYEEWEVIGKSISIFYLPEEVANNAHLLHLEKVINKTAFVFEEWKLRKRGIRFFARMKFTTKTNELGEVIGFRLTIRDITQNTLYEGRLSTIQNKYLSIFNNTFVGVVTVSNETYQFLQINDKAKEILGDVDTLQSAFEQASEFDLFRSILNERKSVNGFEFKVKSKEEKWASIDCKFHIEDKTIEAVLIDITKIKNQALEIAELTKEVNSFIYHASHELRSPMSTILGILNLIQREVTDKIVIDYIGMIREKVRVQDQLLKDLTGVIYNNTSPIESEEICLGDEVSDIIQEFSRDFTDVQVSVSIPTTFQIRSDRVRLRAVFRNIVSNAFKYNNRVSANIIIQAVEDGNNYIVTVIDNGIGMTDNQLMMIYNLFYRGHDGYSGNGLGLFLTKSILTKLGGNIAIKSKKNCGTEVRITLRKQHLWTE